MKRKDFIKTSIYLGGGLSFIGCLSDKVQVGAQEKNWDDGDVAHILPTASHNRMLVSTSYKRRVNHPVIKVGNRTVKGQMRDTKGFFWAFDIQNLESSTTYKLQLLESSSPLCDPWNLKTFPSPESDEQNMKLLMYTCAGGHPEASSLYPIPEAEKESSISYAERRIKLLKRGLEEKPDAVIAIGDQIYWDLSGNKMGRPGVMDDPRSLAIAPNFDMSKPVLGTKNEEILKTVVAPQIVDLYGTSCRSTPIFFFKDDHDYFENDEANENFISMPPHQFQLELARTVQKMYMPEFLPDSNRPNNLPDTSAPDIAKGGSESFGTLRFGKLAEFLMYDCRRYVTHDGNNASFIPNSAEKWLHDRTSSNDVKHTIHVPSTPFGWSAGKWGEWYPDLLGMDGKLHADLGKPYWQRGWKLQHDRMLKSMFDAKHKKPLMISGDLHAFASGRIYQNDNFDFETNPINCILAGPLGNNVFPSTFRKIKASTPNSLDLEEDFDNVEENGFSIVEIDTDNVHVKMYKFLWSRDELNSIDKLNPFQSIQI